MKVVLFCGGFGTRLREHSDTIPKPLVEIGPRPIIWHLMKYYAHQGHTDFILCLGYRGNLLKEYFLNYNECLSNDFIIENGGDKITLENSDIDSWRITFVDTGINSNIGQRLLAVRKYLGDDEIFLANYSDGLSDLPMDSYLHNFESKNAVASFVAVRPSQSLSGARIDNDNFVTEIEYLHNSDVWINGGFLAMTPEIFEYIRAGEELVEEPFQRLIQERRLIAHRYSGFWAAMDTFKDKKRFDDMYSSGNRPWEVWNSIR